MGQAAESDRPAAHEPDPDAKAEASEAIESSSEQDVPPIPAELAEPQHVRPPPPPKSVESAEVFASRTVAVASEVADRFRSRLAEARERQRVDWERVVTSAKLPSVQTGDSIADLAVRLENEADFWRTFALRTTKPGAAQWIASASALLGLSGGLGIALLGGLRGLFGTDASAAVLWAAAGALAVGVVLALLAATWLHRGAAKAAHAALARADESERRLSRVAAILALRHADETAYREALVRLERS